MSIPYPMISRSFHRRTVIPFLGAAASFVGASGGAALPGGQGLARALAELAEYPGSHSDPLPKVAQYVEEIAGGRSVLQELISDKFYSAVGPKYRSCVSDFLSRLPEPIMPGLIVTTNYDVLTERTLEERDIPYFAVSHIVWGRYAGRFLCYESLEEALQLKTRSQLAACLQSFDKSAEPRVLIYKMHGTSRPVTVDARAFGGSMDSLVLTETDYVDFLAKDRLKSIPSTILERLRTSHLLFLGYSLEDWNFRVLLQRLHSAQGRDGAGATRHWAVLKSAERVESAFWDKRGVNVYSLPLEEFLPELEQCLSSHLG